MFSNFYLIYIPIIPVDAAATGHVRMLKFITSSDSCSSNWISVLTIDIYYLNESMDAPAYRLVNTYRNGSTACGVLVISKPFLYFAELVFYVLLITFVLLLPVYLFFTPNGKTRAAWWNRYVNRRMLYAWPAAAAAVYITADTGRTNRRSNRSINRPCVASASCNRDTICMSVWGLSASAAVHRTCGYTYWPLHVETGRRTVHIRTVFAAVNGKSIG